MLKNIKESPLLKLLQRIPRKIVVKSVLLLTGLLVVFVAYHLIQYMQATEKMRELSLKLEQKISIQEQKEYKRLSLSGPVISGNAAAFYQEAETKLEEPAGDIYIRLYETIEHPTNPISPEVLAYYERNKPAIELIKKGIHAETYKPLIKLRNGFYAKIPCLLTVRVQIQITILQGRELETNNQFPEAIELYCNIIEMGDDYVRGGFLIHAIIGIIVSDMGQEEIKRLLLNNKLSEQHLTELIRYLKILFVYEPSWSEVWNVEQLGIEASLKHFAESSGFIPRKSPIEASWDRCGLVNRTDFVNAWKDILVIYKEIKEINSLPYAQANAESGKLEAKIRALKNPLSRIIMQNMSLTAYITYLESQAYRRGIYILSALQLYKIRHQTYPDNLTVLAPEIIPEVPLDPFSNKPFIYKIDQNQKMFLYSIGFNLQDDNGNEKGHEDIVISPVKE